MQMRRFRGFYDLTVMPSHGISVMGQGLAFYSLERVNGHVVPKEVPTAVNYVDTVSARPVTDPYP
jgi:hypothetical protein